jgi:hypothetical protein
MKIAHKKMAHYMMFTVSHRTAKKSCAPERTHGKEQRHGKNWLERTTKKTCIDGRKPSLVEKEPLVPLHNGL